MSSALFLELLAVCPDTREPLLLLLHEHGSPPARPCLCVAYLNLDAGGMALRWMQPRRHRFGGGVVLVRFSPGPPP